MKSTVAHLTLFGGHFSFFPENFILLLRFFSILKLGVVVLGGNMATAAPNLVVKNDAGTLMNRRTVISWGQNSSGQVIVPSELANIKAVAAGAYHSVALRSDGTLIAWGSNNVGQSNVPSDLRDVTAIAAGFYHTVALKKDGTVVAWGLNSNGQTTVPPNLFGVKAIAAGRYHTMALKADSTVVAWGSTHWANDWGQTRVPSALNNVISIASGGNHSVALKSDGTVVAWGGNFNGESTVPRELSGITSIAANESQTIALKNDGTLVAWGDHSLGELLVPSGLTSVADIFAGGQFTVAVRNDSTVAVWGYNALLDPTVPARLTGVIAAATGGSHILALIGPAVGTIENQIRNRASKPIVFRIENTGNENLILGSFLKNGVNSADFTIYPPESAILAPGQTTTFAVVFTPTDVGNRTTHIQIPSNDISSNPFELILSGTGVLTPLETWRQAYFGTAANTGSAADLADPDQDGINNLFEYALDLDPHSLNALPITTQEVEGGMEFTYTRSKSSFLAGLIFQVQTRDSLASGTWGNGGVSSETILNDNGATQTVRVSVVTSPATGFLRLSVTAP